MDKPDIIPFQSARKRNSVAAFFLWIMVVLSLTSFFIAIIELLAFSKNEPKNSIETFSNDVISLFLLSAFLNILWTFIQLIFIVAFLMWLYSVYRNLQSLKIIGLKHTPGWAVGWYFVPIANFLKPYFVMKEIFLATNYAEPNTDRWKIGKTTNLLLVWWLSFLAGNAIFKSMLGADLDVSVDYEREVWSSIIGEPFYMISLICLFLLMRNITEKQNTELQGKMATEEYHNGDGMLN